MSSARARCSDARLSRPTTCRTLRPSSSSATTSGGSGFNADPGIVGKTMNLSSATYQVVGVAPPKLHLPDFQVQLWVPHELDPNAPAGQPALV
jgi:hypothetical protein